jgi:hypothetical protein
MLCDRSESESGGKGEGRHVEGLKVFADFGNELLAALVALREPGVWSVGLGEGEKGERGAGEGEEAADVLERGLEATERRWRVGVDVFYST